MQAAPRPAEGAGRITGRDSVVMRLSVQNRLEAERGDLAHLHAADRSAHAGCTPEMRALPWALSVKWTSRSPSSTRLDADFAWRARSTTAAGGDLFAGRDHGVVLAGVGAAVQLDGGVANELVGDAGHRGDHDRNLVPRVDLVFHAGRETSGYAQGRSNEVRRELHHDA